MNNYDETTSMEVKAASFSKLQQTAQHVNMYDDAGRNLSDKLLCLWRKSPGTACATVLSRSVAEQLLKAQAFAQLDEKRKLLDLFTSMPQMGVARGWLFEAYAHNCLSSGDMAEITAVYTLSPISEKPSKYRPNLDSETSDQLFPPINHTVRVYTSHRDFIDNPAKAGYHIPSAKNNAGFDSYLITETAVYIFQMTVSREHAADTAGQKGLGLLKKMLPSHVPWHYVMVLPPTADKASITLTSVTRTWVQAVKSFRLLVLKY